MYDASRNRIKERLWSDVGKFYSTYTLLIIMISVRTSSEETVAKEDRSLHGSKDKAIPTSRCITSRCYVSLHNYDIITEQEAAESHVGARDCP